MSLAGHSPWGLRGALGVRGPDPFCVQDSTGCLVKLMFPNVYTEIPKITKEANCTEILLSKELKKKNTPNFWQSNLPLSLTMHSITRSSCRSNNCHNFKVVMSANNISRDLQQLRECGSLLVSVSDRSTGTANPTGARSGEMLNSLRG